MTEVPEVTPVITLALVDAFALLLAHVPPDTVLFSVIMLPAHTEEGPLIADGAAFTVTIAVAIQPLPNVYVIVAVPAAIPVTTPVVLIVAVNALLLVHVPPVVVLARVVVLPSHTAWVPVIVAGKAFTVIVADVSQPVLNVYVIALVPATTPVTTPAASMVALAGILLPHVPPVVVLLSVVVRP
jgi:hypothetical protein